MKERRQSVRIDVQIPAKVMFHEPTKEKDCSIENISDGGMAIMLDDEETLVGRTVSIYYEGKKKYGKVVRQSFCSQTTSILGIMFVDEFCFTNSSRKKKDWKKHISTKQKTSKGKTKNKSKRRRFRVFI